MSNGPNRILDDFAKLLTDAAGAAQGVRNEVETAFRAQAERILNSMDVVQREEFEAVREMALKARAENKTLAARLAEIEALLAQSDKKSSKKAASDS
jgi:BMFP domain-containing protein YqiC